MTGDDADRAAAEDGVITDGEEVENDVYVRNVNGRVRRVVISPDATIAVVDCGDTCTTVPGDRTALEARPTPTPVWLTVDGGVITAIEEQYFP